MSGEDIANERKRYRRELARYTMSARQAVLRGYLAALDAIEANDAEPLTTVENYDGLDRIFWTAYNKRIARSRREVAKAGA